MISLEAYRSAIGAWHSSPPKMRSGFIKLSRKEYWKYLKEDMKITEEVNHIYKTTMLLIIGIFILPTVLIIGTQSIGATLKEDRSTDTEENGDDFNILINRMCMDIYNAIIPAELGKILLMIGGIELNPGPQQKNREKNFLCEYCVKSFVHRRNLNAHVRDKHLTVANIKCRFCSLGFPNISLWKTHMKTEHKPGMEGWNLIKSAFKKRVFELAYIYQEETSLEESLNNTMMHAVIKQVEYYRRLHLQVRYRFNFKAIMKKIDLDGVDYAPFYVQSATKNSVFGELNLTEDIMKSFEELRNKILDLNVEKEGSGWSFESPQVFTIEFVHIQTKKMGQYMPFNVLNKSGNVMTGIKNYTINVKNEDDKCVLYNIILSKFKHTANYPSEKLPEELRKFFKYIDETDVEYPVQEKDLDFLERNNKALNISINVWRFLTHDCIEPFYISKNSRKGRTSCDMLLIEGKSLQDGTVKSHLIHIKDKTALFRIKNGKEKRGKLQMSCPACSCYQTNSFQRLETHFKQCSNTNYFKEKYLPANDQPIPYGRVVPPPTSYRSSPPALRGFFDFETLHRKSEKEDCQICFKKFEDLGCQKNIQFECSHQKKKQSFAYTELPAICYSLIVLNKYGKKVFDKYYVGEDAAENFTKTLLEHEEMFIKYIEQNTEMEMTDIDKRNFESAMNCEDCGEEFSETKLKCRDHDHLDGSYRAALCSQCNLQKKNQIFIPLYCHNFAKFDSHLILKTLNIENAKLETLSRNEEQLITMNIGTYKLIDSISFLAGSLDSLVRLLKNKGVESFKQTKQLTKSNFDTMTEKGVFPYEHITDMGKLEETCLPSKESFHSVLKDEGISDEDYGRAEKVWKLFECKTLKDYMKVYCRTDTHLLADVWANFCKETYEKFSIHPESGYITLPSYAFDCFKHKIHKEEKLTLKVIDEEMSHMHTDIDQGVRGGTCMIRKKTSFDSAMEKALMFRANPEERKRYKEIQSRLQKEAMKTHEEIDNQDGDFNYCEFPTCLMMVHSQSKKCVLHEEKCIIAFDFNNLYGHTMTQKMPLDNFADLSTEELRYHQKKFNKVWGNSSYKTWFKENSEEGYIYVADLEFPEEVQKKMLSFPQVPEQMVIESEMISSKQRKTWSKLFKKEYTSSSQRKMVNSFAAKKEYTSHYRLLAFYSSLGVKVTLKRGYKFRQANFIKGYVEFCAQNRKKATNKADMKLWKDLANIIYGKFIEDVKKRVDIRYYKNFEQMDARLKFHVESMPKVINENLVSVKVKRRNILLSKPIHIGFSVLELSKLIMAEFWYNTLIPMFTAEKIQLLYSDTDSYYIQFNDWSYNDVLDKLGEHIDFSNFPTGHPRHNITRKAQFGFVKVDTGEKVIHSFLGEKKKSYQLFMNDSLENVDQVCNMNRKTVKKGCPQKSAEQISTAQLLNLIRKPSVIRAEYTKLQSKNHVIEMIGGSKTASTSFDNSAYYKTCTLCNVPFHCTLEDVKLCKSIECDLNKLLVDVWYRILNE